MTTSRTTSQSNEMSLRINKTVVTEESTSNTRRRRTLQPRYVYEEDEWEKTPRTNYTYADSGSYSPHYLGRNCVSPNMARHAIHSRRKSEGARTTASASMHYMTASASSSSSSSATSMTTNAASVRVQQEAEQSEQNINSNAHHTAQVSSRRQRELTTEHAAAAASSSSSLNTSAHGESSSSSKEARAQFILRSGRTYGTMQSQRRAKLAASQLSNTRERLDERFDEHTLTTHSQEDVTDSNHDSLHILQSPLYGITDSDSEMDQFSDRATYDSSVTAPRWASATSSSTITTTTTTTSTSSITTLWTTVTSLIVYLFQRTYKAASYLLLPLSIASGYFVRGASALSSFTSSSITSATKLFYTSLIKTINTETWSLLRSMGWFSEEEEENQDVVDGSLSHQRRRRQKKGVCCCLPLPCCCLLPLLLLLLGAGVHEMQKERQAFFGLISQMLGKDSTTTIYAGGAGKDGDTSGAGAGLYLSDSDLEARIRAIMLQMQNEQNTKVENRHQELHQTIINQQQVSLNQHHTDLELLLRGLIQAESDKLAARMSDSEQASLAAARDQAMAAAAVAAKEAVEKSMAAGMMLGAGGGGGEQQSEEAAAAMAALVAGLQSTVRDMDTKYAHLDSAYTVQGSKQADLEQQIAALLAKINAVSDELAASKAAMISGDASVRDDLIALIQQLESQLAALTADHAALQASHAALQASHAALLVTSNNTEHLAALIKAGVQENVNAMLLGAAARLDGSDGGSSSAPFAIWLQDKLSSDDTAMDAKIAALAADLGARIDKAVSDGDAGLAAAVAGIAATMSDVKAVPPPAPACCNKTETLIVEKCNCSAGGFVGGIAGGTLSGLTKEQVEILIHDALLVYGADKTGLMDYALESGGGSVISIRCTETYQRKTAQLSLFGIPLWYLSNSPRTVIQPDVNIGQCWPFKGSMGYLVIGLSTVIQPTSFTMEHLPKSMSPHKRLTSAPREFTVLGLTNEDDKYPMSLGNYTFLEDGDPLQHFPVQAVNPDYFPIIELRILNNWGNIEYTCLYRFRVHGKPGDSTY